jgi:hypothetical protein
MADKMEIESRLYDAILFKTEEQRTDHCAICGHDVRLNAGGDCYTLISDRVVCDKCAADEDTRVFEAIRANRELMKDPERRLEVRDSDDSGSQFAEVKRLKSKPCGLCGLDTVGLVDPDDGRYFLFHVHNRLLVCRECEKDRCHGETLALKVLELLRACDDAH